RNWVMRRAARRLLRPTHTSIKAATSVRSVFGCCFGRLIDICIYIICRYMQGQSIEMGDCNLVWTACFGRDQIGHGNLFGRSFEATHRREAMGNSKRAAIAPGRRESNELLQAARSDPPSTPKRPHGLRSRRAGIVQLTVGRIPEPERPVEIPAPRRPFESRESAVTPSSTYPIAV